MSGRRDGCGFAVATRTRVETIRLSATGSRDSEHAVASALRAALPREYRIYSNVRWISKPTRESPARDGETDVVIVHPEHGLLIIETKGGPISRDAQGRWFSGSHLIEPAPFKQADMNKHHLVEKLASLPDWIGGRSDIPAGHAVAFPGVGLAQNTRLRSNLGADGAPEFVMDQQALLSPDATTRWVEQATAALDSVQRYVSHLR